MIQNLQIKNFKSWKDTGDLSLAPLTGFFGTNSSGKTSILQLLLLLKQTVESPDRNRVLNMGDNRSYVDLGTYYDMIRGHDEKNRFEFSLSWKLPNKMNIYSPEEKNKLLFSTYVMNLTTAIEYDKSPVVDSFCYSFADQKFGMKRDVETNNSKYELISENYTAKRFKGRGWPLPAPVKCYGFPDEVSGYYQNLGFLSRMVLSFEALFGRIAYLGPLRDYPKRSYSWSGEGPVDVGIKGEMTVDALLSAHKNNLRISLGRGYKKNTIEERIGYWLKEMGIIHTFELKPIAANRKEYELQVKTSRYSPEVLITDVGFGVSQILPVLVLCYYMPEGSTIILEQPEIHLHPSAQVILADVFVEVVKRKKSQIIIESHSEHLLRRIQRRIAEDHISSGDAALYFCKMGDEYSTMEKLDVDSFGSITNWPDNFFGNDIEDLSAMVDAETKRRSKSDT